MEEQNISLKKDQDEKLAKIEANQKEQKEQLGEMKKDFENVKKSLDSLIKFLKEKK
jgi:molecular chaperone GrpE (heat shock protein)